MRKREEQMTIEEFLETETVRFDFTDDCTFNEEYKESEGYEKYFAYKTQNYVQDPDTGSVLLQEIYKTLWPELYTVEYMKGGAGICSDTMTSVQHTLSCYYAEKFPKEIEQYKKENPRQRFLSVRMCRNMYETYESVRDALNQDKNLKHFISVYHTLGNYTPVPCRFNAARSGKGFQAEHDYWDLTLMKIKEYYDAREKEKRAISGGILQITELLHCRGEIQSCLFWLEGFQSWKDFVEKNYFQDYVDERERVIPFWEGHSWEEEGNKIPDYDLFFRTVCDRIEARTKRMTEALKKARKK